MAAPCVSISVDENEAKTRARDLKVLLRPAIDINFPTASTSTSKIPKF